QVGGRVDGAGVGDGDVVHAEDSDAGGIGVTVGRDVGGVANAGDPAWNRAARVTADVDADRFARIGGRGDRTATQDIDVLGVAGCVGAGIHDVHRMDVVIRTAGAEIDPA